MTAFHGVISTKLIFEHAFESWMLSQIVGYIVNFGSEYLFASF